MIRLGRTQLNQHKQAYLLAAPRVRDAVHDHHPPWHVPRCKVGTDDRFDFFLQLPRKSVPAALGTLTKTSERHDPITEEVNAGHVQRKDNEKC